jgi:hypothetical protein
MNFVRDKVAGVEANTELIIRRNVATSSHRFHECLVRDHASTRILNDDDEIDSSEMILKKKFGCASILSEPVMNS